MTPFTVLLLGNKTQTAFAIASVFDDFELPNNYTRQILASATSTRDLLVKLTEELGNLREIAKSLSLFFSRLSHNKASSETRGCSLRSLASFKQFERAKKAAKPP